MKSWYGWPKQQLLIFYLSSNQVQSSSYLPVSIIIAHILFLHIYICIFIHISDQKDVKIGLTVSFHVLIFLLHHPFCVNYYVLCSNFSMSHLFHFQPMLLRGIFENIQLYPWRFHACFSQPRAPQRFFISWREDILIHMYTTDMRNLLRLARMCGFHS